MKFYFCETCGKRITDADVEAGQARNKKLKGVYCSDCAVGVMTMETLPVSEAQARKILGLPSSNTPLSSSALPGNYKRDPGGVHLSGVRKPGESSAPLRIKKDGDSPLQSSNKKSALVGVGAGLLIALVLGALFVFTGGDKPKAVADGKDSSATGSAVTNSPPATPSAAKKTMAPTAEAITSAPIEEKTVQSSPGGQNETAIMKTGEELQRLLKPTPAPVAIDEALGVPSEISLDLGGGIKLGMKLIPAGEFEMGSNDGDKAEKPAHKVKITRPFYIGKFTVTQTQYERVMGANPSFFKGPDLPVETVKSNEAEEFCKKASALSGKAVRLPTEAEWEYACNAGSKAQFNTGDGEAALVKAAWYKANSAMKTHPVGQKQPNAWGLYDMHGNVMQWCKDYFSVTYYANAPAEDPQGPANGTVRVIRGGSYAETALRCQPTARFWYSFDLGYRTIGFRVAANP